MPYHVVRKNDEHVYVPVQSVDVAVSGKHIHAQKLSQLTTRPPVKFAMAMDSLAAESISCRPKMSVCTAARDPTPRGTATMSASGCAGEADGDSSEYRGYERSRWGKRVLHPHPVAR